MSRESEYSYLLTNDDLYRLRRLISLLEDVVTDLFSERQLAPVEDLDNGPTLSEMRYYELSSEGGERRLGQAIGKDVLLRSIARYRGMQFQEWKNVQGI